LTTNARVASAQTSAPASPEGTRTCTVIGVAVFDTRIHIRCSTPVVIGTDSVIYYAYPIDATHGVQANRYLSVAYTAFSLGNTVQMVYDDSSASNPPGCSSADCRRIVWLEVRK
jgi:hypothetical protein